MIWIIVGAVVCLIAAILLAGFGVLAAADPEGRGGTYALLGVGGGAVFAIAFVSLAVWAIVRWLS